MPDFTEVCDRVWVARHEQYDVNATVVLGERGWVLVDTLWSERAARELTDGVRRLTQGAEAVAVVNTHCHFDHVLGNLPASSRHAIPVIAHESAALNMPDHLDEVRRAARAESEGASGHDQDMADSHVALPTTTFSSVTTIDLGDRAVELVHPGRGHTDGDLVVRLDDADLLLAGDLVEESERDRHTPGFGSDCWPLEWPLTLDLVLELVTPSTVVVPGHGAPVDRAFVEDQRAAIGVVAETIRDLASRGVPVDDALAAAEWPFPAEHLAKAVRRGYAHLPRAQRRLPLI